MSPSPAEVSLLKSSQHDIATLKTIIFRRDLQVQVQLASNSRAVDEAIGARRRFWFNCPKEKERMHRNWHVHDFTYINWSFNFIELFHAEHKKSTVLSEVGLQVWRGAFLLNDFILSNRNLFSNKKIIELGSGVGLTSILASFYAKKVICTGLFVFLTARNINMKCDKEQNIS